MDKIKCPCEMRTDMSVEDCRNTKCKDCCPATYTQTNADRIRAMSDEELAKWLCDISTAECCDRSCPARDVCDFNDPGMIKWLKQPAE